jgi:hypothetical protein
VLVWHPLPAPPPFIRDVIWMDDKTLKPDLAFCFIEDMEVAVKNDKWVP